MTKLFGGIIIPNRPDPSNIARLDRNCLPILAEMQRVGIRVDKSHMVALHSRITTEMAELQEQVVKLTGYRINLGSGDQLSDLLYNKLGLKQAGKEKWTSSKTRLSADSDVLKAMVSKHVCIPIILSWKQAEKLRSTYTHSLIAQADENERIHCDFNYVGTETGRLSCQNPNLQTIPARSKLGKEVRKAFVASNGMVLGTVDLSQIEMRTMAVDSMCNGLLEIFWNWRDLYWSVASDIYRREFTEEERDHGIDPDTKLKFKDLYRFSAKTTALGVTYAISETGLVDLFLSSDPPMIPFLTGGTTWDYDRDYNSAVERCKRAITDFFIAYPEILERRREHHRRARKFGLVWDAFGRHRMIPQVYSTHSWIQGEGLRAAGNLSGQGFAAGIAKLLMAWIWNRLNKKWSRYGIRPLLVVHDDITHEGPKEAMEDFLEEVKNGIRNLIPYELFPCPIESESGMGPNYAESK